LIQAASLQAARQKPKEDAARLRSLEAQVNDAEERLAAAEPRSGWRLFSPRQDPDRQAAETRLEKLQAHALTARRHRAASERTLAVEEQQFRTANARHQSELAARCEQAERRISVVQTARGLIDKNPRLARWGGASLLRVAGAVQKSRAGVDPADAPDDWDLVPALDIWGIPHRPRPKVF